MSKLHKTAGVIILFVVFWRLFLLLEKEILKYFIFLFFGFCELFLWLFFIYFV